MRDQQPSRFHALSGRLVFGKYVYRFLVERAMATQPSRWEKNRPGDSNQHAVDPHRFAKVQETISNGPSGIGWTSPQFGHSHALDNREECIPLRT
jgi:hypothetical protein